MRKTIKISDVEMFLIIVLFILIYSHSQSNQLLGQYVSIGMLLLIEVAHLFLSKRIMPVRRDFDKYIIWYGIFTCICFLSISNSINKNIASENFAFIWKNLIVLIVIIFWYKRDNHYRKLLNIYLIATGYMAIKVLIYFGQDYRMETTLLSVGIHFNGVALLCCFSGIMTFYFSYIEKKKIYYPLFLIFLLTCLATTSRKALILLIFGIACCLLLSGNLQKKVKNFVFLIAIISVSFLLLTNVPGLYERFGSRLLEVFKYFSKTTTEDVSINERNYFGQIAKELFLQNPIWGNGLMACYSYLAFIGAKSVAYAHNNYIEIASSLGIVGLTSYYWIYVLELGKVIKNYKRLVSNKGLIWGVLLIVLFLSQLGQVIYYYNYFLILYLLIGVGIDECIKNNKGF